MNKRPTENTYWVQAGHLLAGEYPGAMDPTISARKLKNFLDCGVRHFIDLTESGELAPYLDQLMALADQRGLQVRHERFAIPDKSIPASSKQMHTILHSLNKALEKQGAVYVHCYGGIGRTGMVIACYLAQARKDSRAALKELDLLWQQMEKKDRWPRTPETPEQLTWVVNWRTGELEYTQGIKMNIHTLEELLQQLKDGKQFDYLYFWGHRKKGAATDKSCFSQWFPASFDIDGIQYATAEHYMMASKARLFNDHAILEKILATDQPDAAKHLGRKISDYDENTWVQHRFQIVVDANYAKFSQHPALAKFLLGTGDSILVEASPVDRIWGIGLAQDHADSKDPQLWQGLNLLGFALMEVRQKLLTERHITQ